MKNFNAYINGDFINTDHKVEILSPKDNSVIGSVSSLNEEQIDYAFDSANKAFKEWKNTTLEQRVDYLYKLCDLLSANKTEMAKLMNLEIAKTIKDAEVEVERTIEYIKDTINAWDEIKYEKMNVGNKTANIHRIPLGVVLAISPFNYPINLSLAKIAPALLIGNTVVFKPATNGSLVGSFLGKLMHEINLPKGVFNLVTGRGSEIGDALTSNKHISMVSFTGGERVGHQIASAIQMKNLVLELGGNDAAYIRHDADLDLAAKEVAKGAFSYSGQRCTAIKRVILHNEVKEPFMEKLSKIVSNMESNPLVSFGAANYVEELINDSKNNNDHFIMSGNRVGNEIPSHIVITSPNSRAWKEEAFGPLLPVVVIDKEDDLISIFNDTDFGLQNSIFTKDVEWAKKVAINIESGTININRSSSRGPDVFPFLGVKKSGYGTQGIKEALVSMSRILNIVEND